MDRKTEGASFWKIVGGNSGARSKDAGKLKKAIGDHFDMGSHTKSGVLTELKKIGFTFLVDYARNRVKGMSSRDIFNSIGPILRDKLIDSGKDENGLWFYKLNCAGDQIVLSV